MYVVIVTISTDIATADILVVFAVIYTIDINGIDPGTALQPFYHSCYSYTIDDTDCCYLVE